VRAGEAPGGLRWGLVGASDIAATQIIPALRRLGHDVQAVLSSSPERGRAYAAAQGIPVATTDLEALVAREEIDAVYISTRNELHRDQTVAAAAAGKHVLCEKPLALTLEDAREMVAACSQAGAVFATNHHLPAAATHRAIRRLVAEGAVGRPLAVRVFFAVQLVERLQTWRVGAANPGAGVIFDITCHDASVVRAILGRDALEAAAVAVRQGPWAAASKEGVEDAVVSALRYEDDVLVQTHDAFTTAFARTGLEVHGTDGSIVAPDVMTADPHMGQVILRNASGEREVPVPDRRDLYEATLEAFEAAVRGQGQPIVDGVDGARALAVTIAVKEAAETGRTVQVASIPSPLRGGVL
jgi:1,5-anhydro-D-fructose reductase (1,5-anhydro-D-mannitol-forming)